MRVLKVYFFSAQRVSIDPPERWLPAHGVGMGLAKLMYVNLIVNGIENKKYESRERSDGSSRRLNNALLL